MTNPRAICPIGDVFWEMDIAAATVNGSVDSPRSTAPSAPATGKTDRRITYGLRESVVRIDVLDQVKQARKAVEEAALEARRGQQWECSVSYSLSKHQHRFADAKMSNTLTPQLLNSTDVRKLLGTTHTRSVAGSPDATRSSASSTTSSGGWNTSIVTCGPREAQARLDATTTASLGKTRGKTLQLVATGRYMDPVSRVEAYNEAIRAHKSSPGGNWDELVVQYGPEGAEAMQHIIELQRDKEAAAAAAARDGRPLPPKPRGRATRDDLAAVRALDDFDPLPPVVDAAPEEDDDEGNVPLSPNAAMNLPSLA